MRFYKELEERRSILQSSIHTMVAVGSRSIPWLLPLWKWLAQFVDSEGANSNRLHTG